jgi:4-hydroxy-tetrahydrodipicolinate synthase
MTSNTRFEGVLTPVIMPFDADLSPDPERLIAQCQWLLSQNVGIAVFGTNSEANSLSLEEKIDLLDQLVESGIDPLRLMPGTGLCALPETVRLSAHVARLGCGGALMLPPFYYKGVSDEGLFRSYSEIIERVGDERLKVYLYHIPPISNVGISLELIERLIARYPQTVVGIKDSSGDWNNTQAMLDRQWDGFSVFAGSESFLLQTMQHGGAGCISATANVNPAAIHALYARWRDTNASEEQLKLTQLREAVLNLPGIPALKAIVSHFRQDDEWLRVRPPLVELSEAQRRELVNAVEGLGLQMPGIGAGV